MGAKLTFYNGTDAINAYNSIEGEAYIWDTSDNKSEALFLEARLQEKYHETCDKTMV